MMRGESALEKEDFKEAIDEFNKVLQQDPSNEAAKERLAISHKKMKTHRENVVRGLVQMNNAGFVMYQRQEYVKAGQSWRDVIHRYESQNDPELQRELPFKIHEVKGTLHQLIRNMLDKGVLLYRQGELRAAVSAWQDVLLIEPKQPEAEEYIEKARVKIETLETLSRPATPLRLR